MQWMGLTEQRTVQPYALLFSLQSDSRGCLIYIIIFSIKDTWFPLICVNILWNKSWVGRILYDIFNLFMTIFQNLSLQHSYHVLHLCNFSQNNFYLSPHSRSITLWSIAYVRSCCLCPSVYCCILKFLWICYYLGSATKANFCSFQFQTLSQNGASLY